jgi:hypothetical protein
LFWALLRLRYGLVERVLWVDAICINQENKREKEQQIQNMARVYGQADHVIVWLGMAAENSDRALQEIRIAGKSRDYPHDEATQKAVVALLQRPWFRRTWVY